MRTETIRAITNFVFVSDKPCKAGIIVVPGSSHRQLSLKAVELWRKGFASTVVFTGGFSEKLGIRESDFGKKIALENGLKDTSALTEGRSTNTKENAIEAYKLAKRKGCSVRTVILISKPYHARRLKMTFAKVFKDSLFFVVPVKDDRNITRTNWWKSKEGVAKVMEEIGKISEYFLKGDLALS